MAACGVGDALMSVCTLARGSRMGKFRGAAQQKGVACNSASNIRLALCKDWLGRPAHTGSCSPHRTSPTS